MLVGSAVAGAGLAVGYSALPGLTGGAREALAAGSFDHQLFLTMDGGGNATVHITKAEIGQHIGTALAQAVAEAGQILPTKRRVVSQRLWRASSQLVHQPRENAD